MLIDRVSSPIFIDGKICFNTYKEGGEINGICKTKLSEL